MTIRSNHTISSAKSLSLCGMLLLLVLFAACGGGGNYTPKPESYLRLDIPESNYIPFDTAALPFTFEQSSLAQVSLKKNTAREKWVDLLYPDLHGVVFLTYQPLRKEFDLKACIDTSSMFLSEQYQFCTGIDEQQFFNPASRVFATTYTLKGKSVASTYQFWATDSTSHFLRGALFLDCTPNNDSLAPLITHLQGDIEHLLETLEWR